jgi:hypothetical protein
MGSSVRSCRSCEDPDCSDMIQYVGGITQEPHKYAFTLVRPITGNAPLMSIT